MSDSPETPTEAATPAAEATTTFADLGLDDRVLKAVRDSGYESPTPIQAGIIGPMLEGRDVLGQAQTGTGKTAAFALPVLSRIDLKITSPQVLVLTPTRELAIQVAEACQTYASHLRNFHILPIYGGQEYGLQLSRLKRGVHVVVGTPGRVMDHLRRGTLKMDFLRTLILDEADEMLRMGFKEDVEWILEQTPPERQMALFSATMPSEIESIAQKYMNDPVVLKIKSRAENLPKIRQRYWMVSYAQKVDALSRILEAEDFDAVLIFVRTRIETVELSERLAARGFASAHLSGDLTQAARERTLKNLRDGRLNILVATDVAARGLDVDRISHVVNYDIPYDTETYIHRIGRTGRAGRSGETILFVTPREKRMLAAIEKATKQKIDLLEMPSTQDINDKRISEFKERITHVRSEDEEVPGGLGLYRTIIEKYIEEHDVPALEVAVALAGMVQGDTPLLMTAPKPTKKGKDRAAYGDRDFERGQGRRPARESSRDSNRRSRDRDSMFENESRPPRQDRRSSGDSPEAGMQRYRVSVGHNHQVSPGNIVGAIANEADLDSKYIGRIQIFESYSTVDLPEGMPEAVLRILQKARVSGRPLSLVPDRGGPRGGSDRGRGKPRSDKDSFSTRAPSKRREFKAEKESPPRKAKKKDGDFGNKPPKVSSKKSSNALPKDPPTGKKKKRKLK